MNRTTISRREVLLAAPVILSGCAVARSETAAFESIEAALAGRIGVCAVDAKSGREVRYRSDERFAMCSTFKAPLAAAVLSRIDAGALSGSALVKLGDEPLLSNSPISARYQSAGSMPVLVACEAVVTHSDNTAANALLNLLGGPSQMTAFFRGMGDEMSRLDRFEMSLNSNLPGDPRDTTTPKAMTLTLSRMVLGDALRPSSRDHIIRWMVEEQRGKARIRAGLPDTWRVANKPGTSVNGATNDIGVAWTPEQRPLVMAIYVNAPTAPREQHEQAIAQIARVSADLLM